MNTQREKLQSVTCVASVDAHPLAPPVFELVDMSVSDAFGFLLGALDQLDIIEQLKLNAHYAGTAASRNGNFAEFQRRLGELDDEASKSYHSRASTPDCAWLDLNFPQGWLSFLSVDPESEPFHHARNDRARCPKVLVKRARSSLGVRVCGRV